MRYKGPESDTLRRLSVRKSGRRGGPWEEMERAAPAPVRRRDSDRVAHTVTPDGRPRPLPQPWPNLNLKTTNPFGPGSGVGVGAATKPTAFESSARLFLKSD